ncbi:hypothetical protein [Thorsellia kenyensis]|uniref:hypothetical protein n=1 Tax=Thorsellia kenyensis TaxID=1549888 RepID=UPI0036D92ED3
MKKNKLLLISSICFLLSACDSNPLDIKQLNESFSKSYPSVEIDSLSVKNKFEGTDGIIYETEGEIKLKHDAYRILKVISPHSIYIKKIANAGDKAEFSLLITEPKNTDDIKKQELIIGTPVSSMNLINFRLEDFDLHLVKNLFFGVAIDNFKEAGEDHNLNVIIFNPTSFENDFNAFMQNEKKTYEIRSKRLLAEKPEIENKIQKIADLKIQLENFWKNTPVNGKEFTGEDDFTNYISQLEKEQLENSEIYREGIEFNKQFEIDFNEITKKDNYHDTPEFKALWQKKETFDAQYSQQINIIIDEISKNAADLEVTALRSYRNLKEEIDDLEQEVRAYKNDSENQKNFAKYIEQAPFGMKQIMLIQGLFSTYHNRFS